MSKRFRLYLPSKQYWQTFCQDLNISHFQCYKVAHTAKPQYPDIYDCPNLYQQEDLQQAKFGQE